MACNNKTGLALLPARAAGVSVVQQGLLKWLLPEEFKRSYKKYGLKVLH